MRKWKKKGSLIIEFLAIVPVLLMLIWIALNVLLYVLAHNSMHEAAMEGARITAMEIRGFDGNVDELDAAMPGAGREAALRAEVLERIETVLEFNSYIEFDMQADDIHWGGDEAACNTHLELAEQAVCVYVKNTDAAGTSRTQSQMVVKIKGGFKLIGGHFGEVDMSEDAGNVFYVEGLGVSQVELTERFQYYYSDGVTP